LAGFCLPLVETSLKYGRGLEELKRTLIKAVRKLTRSSAADEGYFNRRHLDGFRRIREACAESREFLRQGKMDVVILKLKDMEERLENILGKKVSGDVLEEVFRDFCIGK
jgi:tRNA modification GTPase